MKRTRSRNRVCTSAVLERIEPRILLSVPPLLGPELVLPGDTTPALSVGRRAVRRSPKGPTAFRWRSGRTARSGGPPAVYFGTGLGTMTDIFAAHIGADGSVIDVTPIPVSIASYNQTAPKAAWNGTNWLVAWDSEREFDRYETDIQVVRVAPDGAVLDSTPLVIGTHLPNPNGSDDLDPFGPLALASNGSDWFVQYRRHNPNLAGGIGMEWFATKVTADGQVPNPEGTRLLVADQYANDFGIAFSQANGGQFLSAFEWYGNTYTRRYDANMNFIAGSQQLAIGGGEKMAIAGSPSGWIMAWDGLYGAWPQIQAARIAPDGTLLDAAPLEVTDPTYGVDFTLDAKWNGLDWTVAYSNYANSGSLDQDIFTCRVAPAGPSGSAVGPRHAIIVAPDHQTKPQVVGSGNGGYKLLFEDQGAAAIGVAVAVVSPADRLLAVPMPRWPRRRRAQPSSPATAPTS